MTRAQQLVEEALQLPEDDREWIIETLARSVEGNQDESVEEAWIAEANRRSAEIDAGEVEMRPWEETLQKLEKRFVR